MPHLPNDKFLAELTKMSKRTISTGMVSVSLKRYNEGVNCFPSKKAEKPDLRKNQCLIRAVSKGKKISTIVAAADAAVFCSNISSVLRGSITHLERKQRKGKKASE